MSSPTSPPSSVTSSHIPSGPHGLGTLRIAVICKHFTNNKALKCYSKECCSLKPAWLPTTKGILRRTFHLRKAPQYSSTTHVMTAHHDTPIWPRNSEKPRTSFVHFHCIPPLLIHQFSVRSPAKAWCQLIISECLVFLGTYYSQVLCRVPRWVRSCNKGSFQHKSKLCAINNQPRRAS